jgi:hypothetical protein
VDRGIDKRGKCTRRIPVREELSKGWRTWVVDHETESMINVAAFTQSGVQHDGVGVISMICILFMRAGFTPIMWKGDGSKAFAVSRWRPPPWV